MTAAAPQLDLFSTPSLNQAAAGSAFARSAGPPVTLFERMSEIARGIEAPAPERGAKHEGSVCEIAQVRKFGPGGREWAESRVVVWSDRAARLRAAIDAGTAGPGAGNQAFGLEWHVSRLREAYGIEGASGGAEGAPAQVPAEAAGAGPIAAEIAALTKRLAGWQPRFDEELGVALNDGPITAQIRAGIAARIRELEGTG